MDAKILMTGIRFIANIYTTNTSYEKSIAFSLPAHRIHVYHGVRIPDG